MPYSHRRSLVLFRALPAGGYGHLPVPEIKYGLGRNSYDRPICHRTVGGVAPGRRGIDAIRYRAAIPDHGREHVGGIEGNVMDKTTRKRQLRALRMAFA